MDPRRALVLVEAQYECLELWYPCLRLRELGFTVDLVGPGPKGSSYGSKEGYPSVTNASVEEARSRRYEAVIVPGGIAPDKLRRYPEILELVRRVHEAGGLVASICHGPWVLISARLLRGRKLACVSAIRDDVENAGAQYVDAECVVDGNLITARTPPDIPAWSREIVRFLSTSPVA